MLEKILDEIEAICLERYHFNKTILSAFLNAKDLDEKFELYKHYILKNDSPQIKLKNPKKFKEERIVAILDYHKTNTKFYERALEKTKKVREAAIKGMQEQISKSILQLLPKLSGNCSNLIAEYIGDCSSDGSFPEYIDLHYYIYREGLRTKYSNQLMGNKIRESRKKDQQASRYANGNQYAVCYLDRMEDHYIFEMESKPYDALSIHEKLFLDHLHIKFITNNEASYDDLILDGIDFYAKNIYFPVMKLSPDQSILDQGCPKEIMDISIPKLDKHPEKTWVQSFVNTINDKLDLIRVKFLNSRREDFNFYQLADCFRQHFYEMHELSIYIRNELRNYFRGQRKSKQVRNLTIHENPCNDQFIPSDEPFIPKKMQSLWDEMQLHSKQQNSVSQDQSKSSNDQELDNQSAKTQETSTQLLHAYRQQKIGNRQIVTQELISRTPLQAISYRNLLNMVLAFGGKIIRTKGSHQTIQIKGIRGGIFVPHKEPSML